LGDHAAARHRDGAAILTTPCALDDLLHLMRRMIGAPDHDLWCGFDDREDTLS